MRLQTLAVVVLATAVIAPFAAIAAPGERHVIVAKERMYDLQLVEIAVSNRDFGLPKLADIGIERVALPAWKSAGAVVRSESAMPGKSVKPPFREEVAFHLLL